MTTLDDWLDGRLLSMVGDRGVQQLQLRLLDEIHERLKEIADRLADPGKEDQ